MADDPRVLVVTLARRALVALAVVDSIAAASGSGCAPASLAPALTFGATAVVREHAPAGTDPLALRAGAWMTWHATTTRPSQERDMPPGGDAPPTGVAADPSDTDTDRATPEPTCALQAACAWATAARQDALVRLDAHDTARRQEAAP